ncbi:MAG TPA: decaprenyl-phosphate phosphoribosyltransferase [Thermoanaerobaculia bacterium]|nr:decaprenyl-phosphate phosphoribosyltransferase [Thermoanaerobaculia bacterium]
MLPLLSALRPAQWVKNVFVLAPLVFAHQLGPNRATLLALAAFAVFCCAASAVYLTNDLRDREADRKHPGKSRRPIASGAVSPALATAVAALLAGIALTGAALFGLGFSLLLGAYLAINLAYSWGVKHVVILDVMAVASGFVLRVLAGAAATKVPVSSWLVLCTTFLALFLAFSKRRHELVLLAEGAAEQRRVLSQYSPAFLDQMINVVTASAVIAYALYAVAPETVAKYGGEGLLYTVPMVLFGIFRYLYLMYQKPQARNPTEAILTDLPFLANVGLWSGAVLWIVYFRR